MDQSRMPAVMRYGLCFGVVTAVLGVLQGLIAAYLSTRPTGDLSSLLLAARVVTFVFLVLPIGAGVLTTLRIGEVRPGAVAGGIAALCGAVGFCLVFAVTFALQHGSILEGSQNATAGFIASLLIAAPCLFVIGLGLGALGAVFGRARFRRLHAHVDTDTPHP